MITEKIKKFVGQNESRKALDELYNYAQVHRDVRMEKVAIQLQRRLQEARQAEAKGILSAQEIAIEKAKINDAILDLAYQAGEKPATVVPGAGNRAKTFLLAVGGLLAIALLIWGVSAIRSKAKGESTIAGQKKTGEEPANTESFISSIRLTNAPSGKAGARDDSFAEKGYTLVDFGGGGDRWAQANAMALQPDGKILVGGRTGLKNKPFQFALMRFLPDGKLDPQFGNKGKVSTPFPTLGPEADLLGRALVLQKDGRIVMAGCYRKGANSERTGGIAVARYLSSGELDRDFNGNGLQVIRPDGPEEGSNAMAIQPDGKILLAGFQKKDSLSYQILLVRLNDDGQPDAAFGNKGKVVTEIPGASLFANAICLNQNGEILVAGNFNKVNNRSDRDFVALQYKKDGSLNRNFDGKGYTVIDFGDYDDRANSLAIQADEKILLGGYHSLDPERKSTDKALARLLPDGSLDPSFSSDGKVVIATLNKMTNSVANVGNDLAIQPDGKILQAGQSADPNGINHISLIRLQTNGLLDEDFGKAGVVIESINGYSSASAVALQPDGRILVAGVNSYYTGYDFFLGRYHSGLPWTSELSLASQPGESWAWPGWLNDQAALEISLVDSTKTSVELKAPNGKRYTLLEPERRAGSVSMPLPAPLPKGGYLLEVTTDDIVKDIAVKKE
ncbi:MAG: hypothetical protein KDD02_17295 [Phaeodactylibacter sp.]|nr:hypothetical protein [Phaeodactylibacter sp.]MCB9300825.1 hypothetical protein [Lewinellaceae bacterium]